MTVHVLCIVCHACEGLFRAYFWSTTREAHVEPLCWGLQHVVVLLSSSRPPTAPHLTAPHLFEP